MYTIITNLFALNILMMALPTICKIPEEPRNHRIIESDVDIMSEKDNLIAAANRYIDFLKDLGLTADHSYPEEIFSLCAKNCKKIRNGKLLFEGCEFFADQLNAAKDWIGTWSIDVLDLIVSTESNAVIIRYSLCTQKEDELIVLIILRYDSNYEIYEINEVHNKIE